MALVRPNLRFSTTLYQAADESQTTLYPNAVPSVVPCYLIVDPKSDKEEIVKVTAKSTNSITVVRAQGGTSATDHSIGAAVVDYNIPQYFDDLAEAYEGVFNDDGTPKEDGTLVTLDGEQELTNKTLTDPVLNGDLTGDAILDEDDMASDSATKVPTQQSVKAYVDANSGSSDGWTEAGETLTYASATTFTVSGDQTAKYSKGTRIKLTQTGVKYFVVVDSSHSGGTTTVTITGGTDYTLANAAITEPFYSYQASPQGYPSFFSHTSTLTGFSGTPNQYSNRFSVVGKTCHWYVHIEGTSNAAGFTITAPVAYGGVNSHTQAIIALDNGSWQNSPGVLQTVASSTTFKIGKTISTIAAGAYAGFTSSGNKGAAFFISYEI